MGITANQTNLIMNDDKMREVAMFYRDICETAGTLSFLRECTRFSLHSGSRICTIPDDLQERIKSLVNEYYEELKEKQKDL